MYNTTLNQPYRAGGGFAPGVSGQASHILLQRVCYMLATGLMVSAMGAWVFRNLIGLQMPMFIGALVLIFVMSAVARKPGINVLVFYLFCLVEGGAIGPLLQMYVRNFGSGIVVEAFLLTAITVAGVGSYAYTSAKDFGFLGRGLVWALWGLIIFGLVSFFVMKMQTPMIVLGYEAIIVGVFTGFLLYDFSKIRLRYGPDDFIIASVSVYLDFLNLFLAILRILSILQGGGGGRRR